MKKPWIQHADFSNDDINEYDQMSIKKIIEDHDWSEEYKILQELKNNKKENCPPGIGVWNDDNLFHICITDAKDIFTININYFAPSKLLGIIPINSKKNIHIENINMSSALNIYDLFYSKNFDQIKNTTN